MDLGKFSAHTVVNEVQEIKCIVILHPGHDFIHISSPQRKYKYLAVELCLTFDVMPFWSSASRPGAPRTEKIWSCWSRHRGGPWRWSKDFSLALLSLEEGKYQHIPWHSWIRYALLCCLSSRYEAVEVSHKDHGLRKRLLLSVYKGSHLIICSGDL